MTATARLDRDRMAGLMAAELARFVKDHPRSEALHARARASLLDGVPMPWMVKWAGPFPLYVEAAAGAHFSCVDGHDYVDFCLGDTGAMAGHGPAPTIAAVERQLRRGITHMLPTEDAAWVGEELTRRFGVGSWQFALSATDANRWSLRPRPPHQRPLQGRRPRSLLPRVGRRGDCPARRGRQGRACARLRRSPG